MSSYEYDQQQQQQYNQQYTPPTNTVQCQKSSMHPVQRASSSSGASGLLGAGSQGQQQQQHYQSSPSSHYSYLSSHQPHIPSSAHHHHQYQYQQSEQGQMVMQGHQQQQQMPTFLEQYHQQGNPQQEASNHSFRSEDTNNNSTSSSVVSNTGRTHDPYGHQAKHQQQQQPQQQQYQHHFTVTPTLQQNQEQGNMQQQQQLANSKQVVQHSTLDLPVFQPTSTTTFGGMGSGSSYQDDSSVNSGSGRSALAGGYHTQTQIQVETTESSSYQRISQMPALQREQPEDSLVPTVWARHRHHGIVERTRVVSPDHDSRVASGRNDSFTEEESNCKATSSATTTQKSPSSALVRLNMPHHFANASRHSQQQHQQQNSNSISSPPVPSFFLAPPIQHDEMMEGTTANTASGAEAIFESSNASFESSSFSDGNDSIRSQSLRSRASVAETTTTSIEGSTKRAPPSRKVTLASIQKKVGKFATVAKTGPGSSILQAGLHQHPEAAPLMADELLPKIKKLVVDRHAAYVARELLDRLPPQEITPALHEMVSDFDLMITLACRDLHSRRMFQFILELVVEGSDAGCQPEDSRQQLISTLELFLNEKGLYLSASQNGSIAIQRLMDVLPGKVCERFFDSIIRRNFQSLCMNQFGHYVVLYMLQYRHKGDEVMAEIALAANSEAFANAFCGALREYICHKPTAFVIEQSLGNLLDQLERQIVVELFSFETESQCMTLQDEVGFHVLSALAKHCSQKQDRSQQNSLSQIAVTCVRDARRLLPFSAPLENLEACLVEQK